MSQLKFDKHGNLQPYEISLITKEEFKYIFVRCFDDISTTRSELYALYEQFSNDFSTLFTDEFVHWINGSFSSNKDNPNDIDVVTLFEFTAELDRKADVLKQFTSKGYSKQSYSVDSYIVPVYDIRDPRYAITQELVQYWKDWFSYDRQRRKKGFIQINYPL